MNSPLKSVALASLGLALSAQAPVPPPAHGPMGPRGGFHRMAGPEGMARMATFLKLTDDQKAKIKALHEKADPEIQAKAGKAREAGQAYREALEGKTDVARLKALHTAAADARFEVQMAHRQLREDIKAVLTPEQREKAAFLLGARMGRRGGMGRGQEGHPGMGHGSWGHPGMGGCPVPGDAPAPQAKP